MSQSITANVTRMFATSKPRDCSNSVANLGPSAARLTWDSSKGVASEHKAWLRSPVKRACENVRAWARETGAWDEAERAAWTTDECLALLVQIIAAELREAGCDNLDLSDAEDRRTAVKLLNEASESGAGVSGSYRNTSAGILVEYYCGI